MKGKHSLLPYNFIQYKGFSQHNAINERALPKHPCPAPAKNDAILLTKRKKGTSMSDSEARVSGKRNGMFLSTAVPFLVGLVVLLGFGWIVFPGLLYEKKEQPVAFSHKTHVQDQGMACTECHFLRKDGSFAGLPDIDSCASCHAAPLGDTEAENLFFADYIEKNKPVPWLVYAKQPDNVFFSHAAHSEEVCGTCHAELAGPALCATCHMDMQNMDTPPVHEQNILTAYSKQTMKMEYCERCHANPGHTDGSTRASNACFVCHK